MSKTHLPTRSRFGTKLLGGLLSALLVAEGFVGLTAYAQEPQSPFPDIASSYAAKEIASMALEGILSGYEDGSFQPARPITRAELAKIIAKSFQLKEQPEGAASFRDVASDAWYRGYVGALKQSGIVQGTSDDTFSPADAVTREQLVVFFVRALGLEQAAAYVEPQAADFSDMSAVSAWARQDVALAYRIGFVQGMDDGQGGVRFDAKAPAERQALAALAYRAIHERAGLLDKAKAFRPADEKPAEPGASPTPEPFFGGGGGGGGGVLPPTVQATLAGNDTYTGDLTITAGDTYGPASGVKIVNGTLTVNPGSNGEVTLRNIQASNLTIQSGASNTIKLSGIAVTGELNVDTKQQANQVRILLENGSTVAATKVGSRAILDQGAGAGAGSFGPVRLHMTQQQHSVQFRGSFAAGVTVEEGSQPIGLDIQPGADLPQLSLGAETRLQSAAGAHIGQVQLTKPAAVYVSGAGAIDKLGVDPQAQGSLIQVGAGAKLGLIELGGSATLDGDPTALSNTAIETYNNVQIVVNDAIKPGAKQKAVANAEASIGAITAIWEQPEAAAASIRRARAAVRGVLALGGTEADIYNYASLIDAEATLNALSSAGQTEKPSVFGHVYVNGGMLSGSIEPGSEVTITRENGEVIQADIYEKINFYSATINGQFRFQAGERLYFRAKMPGKKISAPTAVTVEAINGKTATPLIISAVYTNSTYVEVTTEDHAFLTITNKRTGAQASSAELNEHGYISLNFPVQVGDVLAVTAQGFGKNVSDDAEVSVLPLTQRLATPEVSGNVYTNGGVLKIRTEGASDVFIKSPDGSELRYNGEYMSSEGFIRAVVKPPLSVGSFVSVYSHAPGMMDSEEVRIPVFNVIQVLTATPTVTKQASKSDSTVAGLSLPNTWIHLQRKSDLVVLNTILTQEDGSFEAYVAPSDLNAGDIVIVTAEALGKLPSAQVETIYLGDALLPATAVPAVSGTLFTNGGLLTVTTEPGSRITVMAQGNSGAFGFTWDASSAITIIPICWWSLAVGSKIEITSQAPGKAISAASSFYVKPLAGKSTAPQVSEPVFNSKWTEIRGTAEPYAQIAAFGDDGRLVGMQYADDGGTFYLSIADKLNAGSVLWLQASAFGKTASDPIQVVVQTTSPLEAPVFSQLQVYENGIIAQGTKDANSYLLLQRADGNYLDSYSADGTVVNWTSLFSKSNLVPGETVYVVAMPINNSFAESDPIPVTVQELSGITEAPSPHRIVLSANRESLITGTAVPGAQIWFSSSLMTNVAVADDSGRFMQLLTAEFLQAGDTVWVSAHKIGQIPSKPLPVTVEEMTQTAIPNVVPSLSTNGGWLDIAVKDPDTSITIYTPDFSIKNYTLHNEYLLKAYVDYDPPADSPQTGYTIIIASHNGQTPSEPVIVYPVQLDGKTATPTVTGDVYATGTSPITISGLDLTAPLVRFTNSQGELLGWHRQTWLEGSLVYEFNENLLGASEEIWVTAQDYGKAESEPIRIPVKRRSDEG
ncbi:S-layer homology domain-containing protein [Paenibacillus athensensis]|uniref:SLH domain-containing protein n=1 Tax=Paenibacillus athensensis TaxID=1967502 RepID=A0A4Y8Q272_9BACL|nr:S-layer homology domain-containing protein [Paenibacillus athensensis]MCD1258622.1 S-layer homology domain-containing protein [Paenibacillus athensensis]